METKDLSIKEVLLADGQRFDVMVAKNVAGKHEPFRVASFPASYDAQCYIRDQGLVIPRGNGCSSEYQQAVREFVQREVGDCASTLVYELLRMHEIEASEYYEDLLSVCSQTQWIASYTCDECEHEWESEPSNESIADECPKCGEITDFHIDTETDPLEALEHWIVSGWLAEQLEKRGEMVGRDIFGLTVWGRRTSGQAILIDGVICDIFDETVNRKN